MRDMIGAATVWRGNARARKGNPRIRSRAEVRLIGSDLLRYVTYTFTFTITITFDPNMGFFFKLVKLSLSLKECFVRIIFT